MSTVENLEVVAGGALGVRQAGRPSLALRRGLVALDAVAAFVGWGVVMVAATTPTRQGVHSFDVRVLTAVAMAATTLALIGSQRLYLARVCSIRAVEISRLGRSAAASMVIALLLPRFVPLEVSPGDAVAGAGLTFALLIAVRGAYRSWLRARRRHGRFVRPVVVVGANEEAADLCKLVADHPELGYRVAGVIGGFADVRAHEFHVPHVGNVSTAVETVRAMGATGVLLVASALEPGAINELAREFMRAGVHVHLSSGLRGIDHRRLRAQPLAHEPLFYVEPLQLERWQLVAKRAIDLAVTVVGGVLVALPVMALAAVAVKLQDRGPVFYRQERIGRHGRPFTIFKLRTMVPDADKLYAHYVSTHAGRDGPLIKLADDPRRTRVGRILERFSIDELPQLWNVLTGTMSLVGPRPAQQSEVDRFDDELLQRLEVPPGITGLWQVEARDNPSFSAYRRYDLFYIENWTVGLDLAILVATFQRVLGRGVSLLGRNGHRELLHPLPSRAAPAVD